MQQATLAKRPKTGGRQKGTPNRSRSDAGAAAPASISAASRARASNADVSLPSATPGDAGSPDGPVTPPSGPSAFPRHRIVRTGSLVPYANNARTHSSEQIDKIVASIREFGFTNPVLTDGKKGIVAGHGRVLAAQKLGMDTVPVIELSYLTARQRRAYVLADNRLALDAGWDDDLLRLELGELKSEGFDIGLTGFSDLELGRLFGPFEGLTDPDDAPEVEAVAVSGPGQVWLLGRHRLVCGSATDEADHARAIGAAKIDAVICDPPYGVGIPYGKFEDTPDNVRALIAEFMPLALRWPVVAVATGNERLWDYPKPTWLLGWALSQATGVGPWGFICYHAVPVWGKDPYLKERRGSRPDTAVELSADREGVKGHPVVKPIAWWKWLVERVTTGPGKHVLDPFSGSGTTLIAAEMTGRIAHAIEIEPRYVDVAVLRWQAFTGKEAIHESGKTFAEVKAERLAVPTAV